MHWLLHIGWGLKHPDAVNIIDKTDVRIYTILAEVRMLQGDEAGAEKWLREAKKAALRFDANPQYRTAHGNRMPVILPNEAMSDWLNPKYNGIEILGSAASEMQFSAC